MQYANDLLLKSIYEINKFPMLLVFLNNSHRVLCSYKTTHNTLPLYLSVLKISLNFKKISSFLRFSYPNLPCIKTNNIISQILAFYID